MFTTVLSSIQPTWEVFRKISIQTRLESCEYIVDGRTGSTKAYVNYEYNHVREPCYNMVAPPQLQTLIQFVVQSTLSCSLMLFRPVRGCQYLHFNPECPHMLLPSATSDSLAGTYLQFTVCVLYAMQLRFNHYESNSSYHRHFYLCQTWLMLADDPNTPQS